MKYNRYIEFFNILKNYLKEGKKPKNLLNNSPESNFNFKISDSKILRISNRKSESLLIEVIKLLFLSVNRL